MRASLVLAAFALSARPVRAAGERELLYLMK
jgi:hypothetical protein